MRIYRHTLLHLSRRQWSVLLTAISLVLWSYSLTQIRLQFGYFGFIHGFPVVFFIALFVLTIAAVLNLTSSESDSKLAVVHLLFFTAAFWLTPALLPGSFTTEADKLGHIDYVIRHAHTTPETQSYQNWPGVFFFGALINMTLGSDLIRAENLKFVPFITQFLFLLPFYLFLRNTVEDRRVRWGAMWLFVLGTSFTGFVPQMLGFFLLLALLAAITAIIYADTRRNAIAYSLFCIVILALLPMTHFLTSLAGLFLLLAALAVRRLKSANLLLLGGVFIAAWATYSTTAFFEGTLKYFVDVALRLDLFVQKGVVGQLGSGAHRTVLLLDVGRYLTFILAAGIGVLLILVLRRWKSQDSMALVIGIGVAILGIIMGAGYGVELGFRIFLFALPLLCYFGARMFDSKVTVVVFVVLLIVNIPLSFVTRYGSGPVEYYSPAYISSLNFFNSYTYQGNVMTFTRNQWGGMTNIESYMYTDLAFRTGEPLVKPEATMVTQVVFSEPPGSRLRYLPVAKIDEALFEWKYNDAQFIGYLRDTLNESPMYNVVYTNSDVALYMNQSQAIR